jgi:hypothetical protein
MEIAFEQGLFGVGFAALQRYQGQDDTYCDETLSPHYSSFLSKIVLLRQILLHFQDQKQGGDSLLLNL